MAKKSILEKAFNTWRAPALRGVEVQDSTWAEWEKVVEQAGAMDLATRHAAPADAEPRQALQAAPVKPR